MPHKKPVEEYSDGQFQFKVWFIMYADFESMLEWIQGPGDNGPTGPGALPHSWILATRDINIHVLSGWCVRSEFAYGEVKDPLKLYRGKDCVKKFCNHVIEEACCLYSSFSEKSMEPLTPKQWKDYKKASSCHICFNFSKKVIER